MDEEYEAKRDSECFQMNTVLYVFLIGASIITGPHIVEGLMDWHTNSIKETYNEMLIKRHKKGWLPKDEAKFMEFVGAHKDVLPISKGSGNLEIGMYDDERAAKIKAKGWYKGMSHKQEQDLLKKLYSEYHEYEDSVVVAEKAAGYILQ